MRKSGVRTVAAIARGGHDPDAIDWRGKTGLLLGGEGPGLTDEAIALCDARVTIPMAAGVESLNVAAAGAILVYAARRQRA
jgi:TrmH family RNA methyltransferase